MRTVAVTLAILSALALVPPTFASDECAPDVGGAVYCEEIPVDEPTTPPGLPGVPAAVRPFFGTYYLWVGPGECTSPLSNVCRGVPVAPGSGIPTPAGNVAVGVFSVLYEESNGLTGLQRSPIIVGSTLRPPDRTVLV